MRTVIETAEAVRRGDLEAVEVLDECLAAIDKGNERLNAFVHLDREAARRAAVAVDDAVARGEDPGPFAGVPIGVKDLEDCAGMPTSHGSVLFKGRAPASVDSVHLSRLRAAGAVPVGKTAAPEFGVTCFTSTKAWGTTRNPWDPTRTPGGSSGGSAAAVASGMVAVAIGGDGGGSIRIPASCCGLVGLKASRGRISNAPFVPGIGLGTTGPLARTVADAAAYLDVVTGYEWGDPFPAPPPERPFAEEVGVDPGKLRIALTTEAPIDAEVDPACVGATHAAG
jgi:aspartyl-tRNA(Asn)/glutamyl-tRNA(Gln) amidotransferase subunit A